MNADTFYKSENMTDLRVCASNWTHVRDDTAKLETKLGAPG